MLAKTLRPHLTAETIDEKESSRMRISAASFATEVPLCGVGEGKRGKVGEGNQHLSSISAASFAPLPGLQRAMGGMSMCDVGRHRCAAVLCGWVKGGGTTRGQEGEGEQYVRRSAACILMAVLLCIVGEGR